MSGLVIRTRADRRRPGSRGNCHRPFTCVCTNRGDPRKSTSRHISSHRSLMGYSGVQVPPGVQKEEKSPSKTSYGGLSTAFVIKQNLCTHENHTVFHSNYNLDPQISRELRYTYKYSESFCIACSYMPPSHVLFWI